LREIGNVNVLTDKLKRDSWQAPAQFRLYETMILRPEPRRNENPLNRNGAIRESAAPPVSHVRQQVLIGINGRAAWHGTSFCALATRIHRPMDYDCYFHPQENTLKKIKRATNKTHCRMTSFDILSKGTFFGCHEARL
jgi:hypothetical protein